MTLHARILTAGALLACVLAVSFCSKKSTGPSGNEPPETTAVIGSEGGTLAVEDFSLSVPPGAFDENRSLELTVRSEDETFGEARATRVFRIEEFPDDFSKPLRLSIRSHRTLSGEIFIAEADSVLDPLSGATVKVYRYHPAVDSSGVLVCVLDPVSGEAPAFRAPFMRPSSSLRKRTLEVLGIDGQETKVTPHFKVTRDLRHPVPGSTGQIVNDMLEQNRETILEETGLDFSEKWPELPVDVIVGPFEAEMLDIFGAYVVCNHNESIWRMAIDQNMIASGQMSLIRILSGMQMLQYSMLRYDILKGDMDENPDPTDNWLHLAIMHWAEEIFTDDPNYRAPMHFPGNEMAPFRGMVKGATVLNAHHDRGMAAVIKFLLRQDYFTRAELFNAYQAINGIGRSAPQDPTEALLSNVQELITVWWPDFFKSYISGGVYGVAPSVFLDPFNLSGTWTIDPDGASEKVFPSADSRVGAYPDLSAKLFLVDAGDADMPENASLSIDVEGEVTDQGLSTLVFAVHPDRLEFLGGGPATSSNPEIRNLKANAEGGVTQYLICVVNSTSHDGVLGGLNVDLNLSLRGTDPNPPAFDLCQVTLMMEGEFEYVRASNGETSTSTRQIHVSSTDTLAGALTDSVFAGNVTWSLNNVTYNQTVRMTFTPDRSRITRLEYTDLRLNPGSSESRFEMVLRNITAQSTSADISWYSVTGEGTCASVESYSEQRRLWDSISGTFAGTSTCTRHWCASSSQIIVTLKKRGP